VLGIYTGYGLSYEGYNPSKTGKRFVVWARRIKCTHWLALRTCMYVL